MQFWSSGLVTTGLTLALLLLAGAALRRLISPLRTWHVPTCMLAGAIGFVFGPGTLDMLPVDSKALESIVYHGLGLTFVVFTLRRQGEGSGARSRGGRSMAIFIPVIIIMQALLALLAVKVWPLIAEPIHTGVGLLLPLGFSQGPGQALTLGSAWEKSADLVAGGQLGLAFAALGFVWSVVIGVPLVRYGRRRGWLDSQTAADAEGGSSAPVDTPIKPTEPGQIDPLMLQLGLVAAVYMLTFGVLSTAADALADKPKIVPLIWAFHFLAAALLAMATRSILSRTPIEGQIHDGLLSRIGSVVVDVTATAALTVVQVGAVSGYLLPLVVISTVGGAATIVAVLWLARRAFDQRHFEYAVAMFGMMTGNTTTGMALVRAVDPEYRTPVARDLVIGGTITVVFALPLLGLINVAIYGIEGVDVDPVLLLMGILSVYLAFLIALWWKLGLFRPLRPLGRVWPPVESAEPPAVDSPSKPE